MRTESSIQNRNRLWRGIVERNNKIAEVATMATNGYKAIQGG